MNPKDKLSSHEDVLNLKDTTEGSQVEFDVYYNSPVKEGYIGIRAQNEDGRTVSLNLSSAKLLELQTYINRKVKLLKNKKKD
jgi:hypothetical protein